MKQIQSLIDDAKVNKKSVERIRYMPYSERIAKNVWFGIAKNIIGKIEITESIKKVWSELIKYVHADPSCIYDLTKSIILMGRTGSGKSATMEILSKYISIDEVKFMRNGKRVSFNFNTYSARDIVSDYAESGYDGIAKYEIYSNICIDDLGTESNQPVMYYGTRLKVINEIIELRYAKGLTTHFTTNMDMNLILSNYDDRVHSRISQQCNQIILNDKDFRINQ